MKKILTILLFFLFSLRLGAAGFDIEKLPQIVSSTAITQDISTSYNPDVEIITAKEIKLYGAENLADLISLISGVNLYRINASSVTVALRGHPDLANISPKILIDGREVQDKFIMKNYLYNMPVSIGDIDRIEIVKSDSFYYDDINSAAGIINIVTKSPEMLEENYINAGTGSNTLKKSEMSINKFLFNTYFKLDGAIRGINEYNSSKRADKFKFINLSLTKYITDNSLLYFKGTISDGDGNFSDYFTINIFNKYITTPYTIYSRNINTKNFFISYKLPSFETSFTYDYNGSDITTNQIIYSIKREKIISKFYKLNLKKSFSFHNNMFFIGLTDKIYNLKFAQNNKKKINQFTLYLKDEYKPTDYITLRGMVKNNRITNYGNSLSYYLNAILHSKNNNYGVSVNYFEDFILPKGLFKFYNVAYDMSGFSITGLFLPLKKLYIKSNKSLKPLKVYSTNIKLFYRKNKFSFKTELFYNRFVNIASGKAYIDLSNLSNPFATLEAFNNVNMVIHGFETDLRYKLSGHLSFFSSYYLQHIKVKSILLTKQDDFFIPRYKVTGGALFDYPLISGSLFVSYLPQIHYLQTSSDDYTELTLNLTKKFFRNRLECSLNVRNLLNNVHKEGFDSYNIKRSFFIKLQYNF